MSAIVACTALAPELDRLFPASDLRYVDHQCHETPLDPGTPERARRHVERAIAAHSAAGADHVDVLYPLSAGDRAAIDPATVPVTHHPSDCIDWLSPEAVNAHGERKAPRTYYLTPGTIEVGLDPYKYARAASGAVDARSTPAPAPSVPAVSPWHETARVRSLVAGPTPDEDLLEAHLRAHVGGYERVELLTTPAATPAHRRYAHRLARFLEAVAPTEDRSVTVEVTPATLARLRALDEPPTTDHPMHQPEPATTEP
ncbi:MAG: hypothetical protein ACOC0X_03665 [Halobacteriota archaeon]